MLFENTVQVHVQFTGFSKTNKQFTVGLLFIPHACGEDLELLCACMGVFVFYIVVLLCKSTLTWG